MGLSKREWEEAQERGWSAADKYVCVDCMEDDYLKSVITGSTSSIKCDYCSSMSDEEIGAPLEVILGPIADALLAHFAEPAAAGLPRDDGDWVGADITDTYDALMSLPLTCDGDLFDDIARSFHNTAWIPCADGFWLALHRSDELHYSWESFVSVVKYRSRYFFSHRHAGDNPVDDDKYSPMSLLEQIGHMASSLELVRTLPAGMLLYRVRQVRLEERCETFEHVGPPPEGLAIAGRMNPAGISYFYLAFESTTAFAEVLVRPPCQAALANCESLTNLIVLDLTLLPPLPSVFDNERRDEYEAILFLLRFVKAISEPVTRDGQEHIEYVPSQVVSEFFAQMFHTEAGVRLDGLAYPSTVMPGGKNLVLFPIRELKREWPDFIALKGIEKIDIQNWPNMLNRLGDE